MIDALLTYAMTLVFYLYLRANTLVLTAPRSPLLSPNHLAPSSAQAGAFLNDSNFISRKVTLVLVTLRMRTHHSRKMSCSASALLKRYRKYFLLTFDDLAELLQEAEETAAPVRPRPNRKPLHRHSPSKNHLKKKRRILIPSKPAPVFDLEEPTYLSPKPSAPIRTAISAGEDVFGDAEVWLDAADAADNLKKARGLTLRSTRPR